MELARGHVERDVGQAVGERGERAQRLAHRRQPQQVTDRDPQQLAPPQQPQRVARLLAPSPGDLSACLGGDRAGARRLRQHARTREPLRPLGVTDHLLAQERAAAERPEQRLARARTALEECFEGAAAVLAHEALEANERALGVGNPRERGEQRAEAGAERAARARRRGHQAQLARGALGLGEAAAPQPRERRRPGRVLDEPRGGDHAHDSPLFPGLV